MNRYLVAIKDDRYIIKPKSKTVYRLMNQLKLDGAVILEVRAKDIDSCMDKVTSYTGNQDLTRLKHINLGKAEKLPTDIIL